MRRLLRAGWVIARRDYVAIVRARSFLVFLLGPLLPLLFVAGTAALDRDGTDVPRGAVQVAGTPAEVAALRAGRQALARRLGDDAVPRLIAARPGREGPLLAGGLDRPTLRATPEALRALAGPLALIVDTARATRALRRASPPPVELATATVAGADGGGPRADLARGGQFVLFFLTLLLAGMMITNLVEERAGKVIELLAAAVPVEAIFLGKLLGMLGASLTGIALWAGMAATAAAVFLPPGTLPEPAVGWIAFGLLGIAYFVAMFLLWGAVYLAVGAQAGSAREAQTLAMPLTLAQAMLYTLATAQAGHPDRPLALALAALPWSSPYTMLARAAERPTLWPHLPALGWQLFGVAFTIALGVRAFRSNILKSGSSPGRRRWWRKGTG